MNTQKLKGASRPSLTLFMLSALLSALLSSLLACSEEQGGGGSSAEGEMTTGQDRSVSTTPGDQRRPLERDRGTAPGVDGGGAAPLDRAMEPPVPGDDQRLPPPSTGENLLQDPSFEEGSDAWNLWGGAARVEVEPQEGRWALRATARNGAEQRVDGLISGATYRLSGWGKSESDEPMLIGVKDYGGEQVQLIFREARYLEDTLSFTVGAGQSSAIVFAYKHAENAPGYADALSLQLESAPPPPPPAPELTLVWSDEFDGTGPLDPEKWGYEEGFQRNEELQWYQAENAFREDGLLVIEGRTERRPNPNHDPAGDWRQRRSTIEYTSASVITADRFSWRYGRLEVRAKVSNARGTWPAIWTLGVRCEWPSSGEVDVMENYGGNILANFAWGTNQRWNARWDSARHPVERFGPGWTDDFHIWTLDWTEERMRISLDGEILNDVNLGDVANGSAACAGENPFRQEHYLLLNLALGGAGGPVDGLEFPTRYLVDYVRVYQ